MKNKFKKITTLVDNADINKNVPEEIANIFSEHKKVSVLLKQAYLHEVKSPKLDYLSTRVLAKADKMKKPGLFERLFDILGFTVRRHRSLVWYSFTATMAIVIIATTVFNRRISAQPQSYESFVIYETEDGNSFVRYFDYQTVNNNEKNNN